VAPLNKKKEYLSDGTTGDWVAEIQGRRDEAAEDQKPRPVSPKYGETRTGHPRSMFYWPD